MARAHSGRWLAAVLSCLQATPTLAAQLEVAPVVHELPAGRQALAMTVTNRDAAEVVVQLRGFAWRQEEGEERLLPAPELQVSPPFFTLAPGASQVVRALVQAVPAEREATYRLILDGLPAAASTAQLQFALRVSVPVFVAPRRASPARIRWTLERDALVASNEGGRRERLRDVRLRDPQGRAVELRAAPSPYLLAGAQKRWPLAEPATTGTIWRLSAQTDEGAVDLPVAEAP